MGLAPYGLRWEDIIGSQPFEAKGLGYFGEMPTSSGVPMTELSTSFDVNGKQVSAPLIVPTLSSEEMSLLAEGREVPDAIYDKAIDFALRRISEGKNPFAEMNEIRVKGLLGF